MDWVVIPDIHGDLGRLRRTMAAAGFSAQGEGFRHPEGRKVLFLGDLIDNGPENAAVIRAVRAMVDDGEGLCLLGNHELNAILISVGNDARLPSGPPSARVAARAYGPDAPTLLIGHYKMRGVVAAVSHNVVCLDYPDEELFCEAGPDGVGIRDASAGRLEM